MKKFFLLIVFLFLISPGIYGQEAEKTKEDKTFVGKGLAEIDNVATKAWQELMKLFKKRPFAYKPGKGKHETKIKRHNPPENYIFTKKIVSTSKDSFRSDDTYKKNKADFIIKNDFTKKTLKKSIKLILRKILDERNSFRHRNHRHIY